MPALRPIPTIVDCDPGIDDAIALWLAIASAEIDLRAVTVAGGNVALAQTGANALAVTALARSAVPVFAGADRPLRGRFAPTPRVHGVDGMGGVALPPGRSFAPGPAADAIRILLRAAEAPVTLVGLAPATNFALALMAEPRLAERIAEIVLMAGAWSEDEAPSVVEFNAGSDPEALAFLLGCGPPVRLATLELTAQALVTPGRIRALCEHGSGACLAAGCAMLAALPPAARLGGRGAPLHDPCAIAWLIRPSLFSVLNCAVAVELAPAAGRGRTRCDRRNASGAAANATLLETLDADGFFDLLGERLARLP